jgi:hypothetical protein
MALYLREPWAAHQKYRVFGDLETKIFSYYTSASQIRLAQLVNERVQHKLKTLTNRKIARYGLTSFLLIYLVGEIIRQDAAGTAFLDEPLSYLDTNASVNPHQSVILAEIDKLVDWIVIELNYTIEQNGGESYDYKSEFKSPKSVQQIRNDMLKSFQKDISRGKVAPVSLPQNLGGP